MLKFIVDGKVVMEDYDDGKLNIIDEKLKESFEVDKDEQEDRK